MTQPQATSAEGRPLLPQLLEKTDLADGFRFQFKVPENLYFFDGHFDRVPVVAGVCQLKWVHDLIRIHFNHHVELTAMEVVKFHQLLFPGQTFHMEIRRHAETQKWSFLLTCGDKKVSSGRLLG